MARLLVALERGAVAVGVVTPAEVTSDSAEEVDDVELEVAVALESVEFDVEVAFVVAVETDAESVALPNASEVSVVLQEWINQ